MARKSQWDKGVDIYKEELKERLMKNLQEQGKTLDDFRQMVSVDKLEMIYGINVRDRAERNHEYAFTYAEAFSTGGMSLVSNEEIAERLCTPSERKHWWLYDLFACQTRALFQAYLKLNEELCCIY